MIGATQKLDNKKNLEFNNEVARRVLIKCEKLQQSDYLMPLFDMMFDLE